MIYKLHDKLLTVMDLDKPLEGAMFFIPVSHNGHPDRCDGCHVKWACDEIFGNKGVRCELTGERYHELDRETIELIKKL